MLNSHQMSQLVGSGSSLDLLHQLHAADRADATGRALATRLLGAELEGVAGLLSHVHRVIEDDHAAVADLGAHLAQGLVGHGQVEVPGREVGAQGSTDLHGSHRPAFTLNENRPAL